MILGRREFAIACASSALVMPFASSATLDPADHAGPQVRYVHAEIGAGPWPRHDLARISDAIARIAGVGPLSRITAIGAASNAASFPERFVLTLFFGPDARMVLRASDTDGRSIALTIRYADGRSRDCEMEYPGRND